MLEDLQAEHKTRATLASALSLSTRTTLATLRHVYPLPRPPPTSFPALKSLLTAAHKYSLTSLLADLRPTLQTHLPTHALRVFALAHRFNMPDVRAAATRSLLRVSYRELRHRHVEELEEIPAADYFRLLVYHDQCGQAFSAFVLAHALSYSGATPSSARNQPEPKPHPPPGKLRLRGEVKCACDGEGAEGLGVAELDEAGAEERGRFLHHVLHRGLENGLQLVEGGKLRVVDGVA